MTLQSRNSYLLISLICVIMTCVPAVAEPLPDPPSGFHGMLVLGTRGHVYLTHLAMRNAPEHMFQLILEVEFQPRENTALVDNSFVTEMADPENATLNQQYFFDRNHPDNDVAVYTLRPRELFVLTELPRKERLAFRGDIVRGHFERDLGPPVLFSDVQVKVSNVVFFQDLRELDQSEPHPLAANKREYLLFGSDGEFFLTHRITLHGDRGRPDNNGFHQVLSVPADAAEELTLDLSSQAASVVAEISASETTLFLEHGGVLQSVLTDPESAETLQLSLKVNSEHYFEELM